MTIQTAFDLARATPTPIVLKTVIDRLGGFRPVASLCLMGPGGHRSVREWYFGAKPVPRLCWAVMVAADRQGV